MSFRVPYVPYVCLVVATFSLVQNFRSTVQEASWRRFQSQLCYPLGANGLDGGEWKSEVTDALI